MNLLFVFLINEKNCNFYTYFFKKTNEKKKDDVTNKKKLLEMKGF